jgi:hypothetical protein
MERMSQYPSQDGHVPRNGHCHKAPETLYRSSRTLTCWTMTDPTMALLVLGTFVVVDIIAEQSTRRNLDHISLECTYCSHLLRTRTDFYRTKSPARTVSRSFPQMHFLMSEINHHGASHRSSWCLGMLSTFSDLAYTLSLLYKRFLILYTFYRVHTSSLQSTYLQSTRYNCSRVKV